MADCHESTHTCCAMSEDELDAITGGDKAAPPPSKPASGKLFEIDDFSFDIEQVLH